MGGSKSFASLFDKHASSGNVPVVKVTYSPTSGVPSHANCCRILHRLPLAAWLCVIYFLSVMGKFLWDFYAGEDELSSQMLFMEYLFGSALPSVDLEYEMLNSSMQVAFHLSAPLQKSDRRKNKLYPVGDPNIVANAANYEDVEVSSHSFNGYYAMFRHVNVLYRFALQCNCTFKDAPNFNATVPWLRKYTQPQSADGDSNKAEKAADSGKDANNNEEAEDVYDYCESDPLNIRNSNSMGAYTVATYSVVCSNPQDLRRFWDGFLAYDYHSSLPQWRKGDIN